MEVKNQEKQDEDYVHIFQNSANIIQDIRQQKSSFLPGIITFKCRWIKGHQKQKRGKWTDGGVNRTRKWVYQQNITYKNVQTTSNRMYQLDYGMGTGQYVDQVKMSTFNKTQMYSYLQKAKISNTGKTTKNSW